MKTYYAIGLGLLAVVATIGAGFVYLTQRHIDRVNALVEEARYFIDAGHKAMLRRGQYVHGTPEARYRDLCILIKDDIAEILAKECEPIRNTAEAHIYHYVKKVVYRDLP